MVMKSSQGVCAVCLSTTKDSSCEEIDCYAFKRYRCDICGQYKIPSDVETYVHDGKQYIGEWALTPVQRAALSHLIRKNSTNNEMKHENLLQIDTDRLSWVCSNGKLPSADVQASNLIRFIGDEVRRSGHAVGSLPMELHAIIGAFDRNSGIRLVEELVERNVLRADPYGTAVGIDPATNRVIQSFTNIDLSLDGWALYESEKRGQIKGHYGFIAMRFDDPELDDLVKNVVKPAVKSATGYELVDMKDRSRAGIIDNIMRAEIRGASFVISDLSHDNLGAYWEAGYAEGLDKPVVYICEEEKFHHPDNKPHFDTNHCTTILWSKSRNGDDEFKKNLTATLRRSLDL